MALFSLYRVYKGCRRVLLSRAHANGMKPLDASQAHKHP